MIVYKTLCYRVYPTLSQQKRLGRWRDSLRFLWNLANEQRRMGYGRPRDERRFVTGFDQIGELKALCECAPWLADVPRNVCSQLLIELDRAWKLCFMKAAREPHWKRKGQDIASICESDPKKWRLAGTNIRFPKLGVLRTVMHRPLQGTPKSCSLRSDGSQWFALIVCEIDVGVPMPRPGPVIAIDRGITNTLADSAGGLVPNPKHYELAKRRLARANRAVSRKKKGSRNREKAKARYARLHQRIRRQRSCFLHAQSSRYAKSHGVVVIEKLRVADMKRSRLAQSITGAGWTMFAHMLRYKLAASGGTLVEVPAQYSSQTCSSCGVVDAASRSLDRFSCTACNHVDHADLNAAKILKQRYETPGNPWCLPVEGSALEASRRSRKAKQTLRVPRRKLSQSASGADYSDATVDVTT